MNVVEATASYEHWLGKHLTLVPEDLTRKHEAMRSGAFSFARATFYQWAHRWPEICPDLQEAPRVLAVGDLHVENFGTWRDAEGRLVWGVNDFDEAVELPYCQDLVRLASSAIVAAFEGQLRSSRAELCGAVLKGYRGRLQQPGTPYVLAEQHLWLRDLAQQALKDPATFWQKLNNCPTCHDEAPPPAVAGLEAMLPEKGLRYTIVRRVAGLGSLGRQRFVALADWRGGQIAREAKALACSAAVWAGLSDDDNTHYPELLQTPARSADPWIAVRAEWLVRRLAPDCSRIDLTDLPGSRDEKLLLRAMGKETANIHTGLKDVRQEILRDLDRRPADWLTNAAEAMAEATLQDWKVWRAAK